MKLAINKRTKVLAGVVVLLGAAAAAWFLFIQDWLNEPSPQPVAVAKPAAAAPAPAAAKPAAEAPKPAPAKEAPKPMAEPAKPAVAMKAPPKPVISPVAKELAREAAAKPQPKAPEPAPEPVKEPEPAPVAAAEAPKPAAEAEAPKPAPVVSLIPASLRGPATPGPKFNDLVTAVLYRDPPAVDELLKFGKWADKPDSRGTTPLMLAVELGEVTIAEALLKAGASPGRAMAVAQEQRNGTLISLLERYSRAGP